MKQGMLLLLSCFGLIVGFAETAGADLDQLWAVRTLLRAELDGEKICAGPLREMTPQLRATLPQLLEAEIQTVVSEWSAKQALLPYLKAKDRLALCEIRCRCDIYDEAAGMRITRHPRRALSEASIARCAKLNAAWICKSKTLRGLIREAHATNESGS